MIFFGYLNSVFRSENRFPGICRHRSSVQVVVLFTILAVLPGQGHCGVLESGCLASASSEWMESYVSMLTEFEYQNNAWNLEEQAGERGIIVSDTYWCANYTSPLWFRHMPWVYGTDQPQGNTDLPDTDRLLVTESWG